MTVKSMSFTYIGKKVTKGDLVTFFCLFEILNFGVGFDSEL